MKITKIKSYFRKRNSLNAKTKRKINSNSFPGITKILYDNEHDRRGHAIIRKEMEKYQHDTLYTDFFQCHLLHGKLPVLLAPRCFSNLAPIQNWLWKRFSKISQLICKYGRTRPRAMNKKNVSTSSQTFQNNQE
jgi:hypothetical protein